MCGIPIFVATSYVLYGRSKTHRVPPYPHSIDLLQSSSAKSKDNGDHHQKETLTLFNNQNSLFLSLPSEIRNHIYRFCLRTEHVTEYHTTIENPSLSAMLFFLLPGPPPGIDIRKQVRCYDLFDERWPAPIYLNARFNVSLLRTCRQIYEEASLSSSMRENHYP